jgi:hypothetical protein
MSWARQASELVQLLRKPRATARHARIEISLRNVNQLFNSMDPSPFLEKDLDHDAEEFLVGWAQEHPREQPLELVLHLQELPLGTEAEHKLRDAVRNYFVYRARLSQMSLRELLRQGRVSLGVGLGFLAALLLASDYLATHAQGTLAGIVQESLSIGGWVAMWRPLQIYLYDWWPIRNRSRLYERMGRMDVVLRKARD